MTRVTIFEDSKIYKEGLSLMVQQEDDLLLAGVFGDATNVLTKIRKTMPDVVLMDIKMPEVSGINAVREVKTEFPEIQVLMLTVFEEEDKIFAAICAGASGYLLKGTSNEKLIEAIKDVRNGGSPMTPNIARKVLLNFQQNNLQTADYQQLTTKEKEILSYLVEGKSHKMIADITNTTYNTINTHLKNTYQKLHVNNGTEAVAKALKHRLVSLFL